MSETNGGAWILRWDTVKEPAPRLLWPTGPAPAGGSLFEEASGSFVAFDGYLFDRGELAPGEPRSDAWLVAAAYQRWGAVLLDKLRGAFTLAVWDQGRKRLTVGRDAMGLRPCFYRWDGRVLFVSPMLDALLAQPEVPRRFNRVVIAEFVQNWFPPQQAAETFYEGVSRLPPAHVLELAGRTLTLSRYWDPVPPGFTWASDEELGRFMPIMERAVDRCLAVGADCLALSGGFDSVSIAAVAAGFRGYRPVHALSTRFVGTEYDEGETQIAVAHALRMPQMIRLFGDDLDGSGFVDSALILSRTTPAPLLSPWLSLYTALVGAAAPLGLRRMMMGTGGDEMFGLDPSYGADCLAALDLGALWRYFRAVQRASAYSVTRVARALLWRNAALPVLRRLAREALERVSPRSLEGLRQYRRRLKTSWLVPEDRALREVLEERVASASPMMPAPGSGAYVEVIRRLLQSPLLLTELEQYHAWARGLGFEVMLPYYDRDLVELTLTMPPEHLIAGGRLKAPLRQLVTERLNGISLPGRKADYTQAFHRLFRPGGRRAWRRLGGPRMLAELGVVDARRLNRMIERYFEGSKIDPLIPWMVLSAEGWLQERGSAAESHGVRRVRHEPRAGGVGANGKAVNVGAAHADRAREAGRSRPRNPEALG